MAHILCSYCGENPIRRAHFGFSKECQACYNKRRRNRYRLDSKYRGKILVRARNKKLNDQLFNEILSEQAGLCGICCSILIPGPGTCVDHCHTTGQIRGILCNPCNRGLGHFQDDQHSLEAAAKYLEANHG